MVVCSPASLSRSLGVAGIWSLGHCVRGRNTHLAGHALFTHTLQEFEVSNQIKVHVSKLWEETGVKVYTGPGEKNICKRHIESKPKPKPSRWEATGLITAGIKPEIQTTTGAWLRFTSLVNAPKYSTTCDLWHLHASVFISLTWKSQDYDFFYFWR